MAMSTKSVFSSLACQLPPPAVPDDVDANRVAKEFESKLSTLRLDDLYPDCLWRDIFAFTGDTRTFIGTTDILARWKALRVASHMKNVTLETGSPQVIRIGDKTSWVEAEYNFDVEGEIEATCKAILSLVPGENRRWQIWVLRTILGQLKGHPSVDHFNPSNDVNGSNGFVDGTSDEHTSGYFDCVIVGGGHAGLSVAGRLKALKVSYVVLDRNKNVGDNWRLRYDTMKLHTTRESAHLPFDRTFQSAEYPKFLGKDDVARGYSKWVRKFGINIWLESNLLSGQWDAEKEIWKLKITRDGDEQDLTTRHVIMAIGAGGQIPKMPALPEAEQFEGTILHSSQYRSAKHWKGKDCVVVGTGNSAQDVAVDMADAGCSSVTMVQRSPTYVFRRDDYEKTMNPVYNDDTPVELADMAHLSVPLPVVRLLATYTLHSMAEKDSKQYDALEQAGFKLLRNGDIIHSVYERAGGFHMDVGGWDKILDGSIKIKSDALPVKYDSDGIRFSDESRLKADVVVYCTGFEGDTRSAIRDIFGRDIADQTPHFWGLDHEAELRGAYRPTRHPKLWLMGGPTYPARFYSRFTALSIRADLDGRPLTVLRD